MVGRFSLDGQWRIKGIDGRRGGVAPYCAATVDERTFIKGQVPGEVHLDLWRQGLIQDPNLGTNALAARWVEEQFWIYRRTFTSPDEALNARSVWLVFQGLDLAAEIYLNGRHVGSHANAFRPCRIEVSAALQPGVNTLAVSLDAGLHHAGERPAEEYDPGHADGALHKRMWLRKPQYQFAWDWNPRLVNVGIYRSVDLEWSQNLALDGVTIFSELSDNLREATVYIRGQVINSTAEPIAMSFSVSIGGPHSGDTSMTCIAPPGISSHEVTFAIQEPELWWPRGYGAQPLYTVRCDLGVAGEVVDSLQRRTGIRSVRIDQSPHREGGQYFVIQVNDKPIFCKGGNWVPADMIYGAVDAERLRKLIDLAVVANFNTLRIWGGGIYVDHTFLDLCDEAGLLVWHDFIFACAQYPADNAAFLRELRQEVTHVVRDLSPHPSLAVWCGNNEIEWGEWDWGYDQGRVYPDHGLYHLEIPRIIAREDPSRPYWPSSPYSGEAIYPNEQSLGDQHPWHVSISENRANFWAYRQDASRFPNEGGALGASSVVTLRQFLPAGEQHYLSPSWEYHDNEIAVTANNLINEEWFAYWLGLEPAALSLDEYAYYSGLLQAEALVEYINNFRRRMFSTSSAIFWMYNDSWPVTHGWTIVDYYLRRKLAYHPVRRAFDPVQIVVAVEDDRVLIVGINDSTRQWRGEARYGFIRLDGQARLEQSKMVALEPNRASVLAVLSRSEWETLGIDTSLAYATLWQDEHCVRQNRLFLARYKEIVWPEVEVQITREGNQAVFYSDRFVWGVCLDPTGEIALADDVFDLLPGIPWSVPWPTDAELPRIAAVGNDAL